MPESGTFQICEQANKFAIYIPAPGSRMELKKVYLLPVVYCPSSPAFQDGAKADDPPTVAEMVQEWELMPLVKTIVE